MTDLIIATTNPGKVAEFRHHLGKETFRFLTLSEIGFKGDIVEDAPDFAGNALLKVKAVQAQAPADAWILADDSGLEVEALQGAPGVHTARYAGPAATDQENIAKLLNALQDNPNRKARFVCWLCLHRPGHQPLLVDGECRGSIALSPAGTQGFGYDPIFRPQNMQTTFAEMDHTTKKSMSHRGHALHRLSIILELRN